MYLTNSFLPQTLKMASHGRQPRKSTKNRDFRYLMAMRERL
uniref:Uncharacterized protein n=1 Tax=Rhizophora mucronata TaxID=61149 RepID=A0A2P2Q4Y0_RHIMU